MSLNHGKGVIAHANITAIIHLSPSYTPEAPKWRVLCPLSREYPPTESDRFIARLTCSGVGRSLVDLLGFLGELHAKKVDLYLHQQGLDTSTPAGRAMFQMLGLFAEFERGMIRERVRAGIARARISGTKSGRAIGRPPVADDTKEAIQKLLHAGQSEQAARR